MKPVILCVDDTPSLLEGEKMLLEENGYRVLIATNGKEAVHPFASHSVDLVPESNSPLRGRIHLRGLSFRPTSNLLQFGGGPYIERNQDLYEAAGAADASACSRIGSW
jgi:DNA-binding NarL/FixJ family response regulator